VLEKDMKTTIATLITILLTSWAIAKEPKPLIVYRIGDVPVEMREGDEYGVMLVNDGGEENSSPRYIVAIAKTRTVVDTKDLELFKAIMERIPKGSTIFEYGSCTVPRSWGLTENHFKTYNEIFSGLGLTLSDEPRTTCYCDSLKK
jgi:hypothetical protein